MAYSKQQVNYKTLLLEVSNFLHQNIYNEENSKLIFEQAGSDIHTRTLLQVNSF